jgi:hypothetical protein
MEQVLNEMQRRQYAATLSKAYGYGGAVVVHEITGLALNTITRGKKELLHPAESKPVRVRKTGGGPKRTEEKYPDIRERIRRIVEGSAYGSPEKILSWMDGRQFAGHRTETGGPAVTHVTIGSILEDMGYGRQANQKMPQAGKPHPDRNAQFEFINGKAGEFIKAGEPVVSTDTKKKENIGNFKNPGTEYRRGRDPRKVLDHDFPIKELGKTAPYGVFFQNNNTGFVNAGTGSGTAGFAVESIARWWHCVGKHTFPRAARLLITCGCGGSNGYRNKLWKFRRATLRHKQGLIFMSAIFRPARRNGTKQNTVCFVISAGTGKGNRWSMWKPP